MQYHPAYDSLHAAVRAIRIVALSEESIDRDVLSIIDYCLLFPSALKAMKLPQDISRKIKAAAETLTNTYDSPIGNWLVFQNIQPIQNAALKMLVTGNVLRFSDESQKKLKRGENFSEWLALALPLDKSSTETEIALALITIPPNGPNGLKARSHLMEYRYDAL